MITVMFLLIIRLVAGCDHWVQLRQHDRALSNRSELAPGQFIHEMAENVVIFLLPLDILDGQLKLALYSVHE